MMSRIWTLFGTLSIALGVICGATAPMADASAPAVHTTAFAQSINTTTSDANQATGPYVAQCQGTYAVNDDGHEGFGAPAKAWQSWKAVVDVRNCVDENMIEPDWIKAKFADSCYWAINQSTERRADANSTDTGNGLIFYLQKRFTTKVNPTTHKSMSVVDSVDCTYGPAPGW